MAANARQYVIRQCAVTDAARAYADFLAAVIAGHAASKNYAPPTISAAHARENPTRAIRAIPDDNASLQNQHSESIQQQSTDWRDNLARAYVALGLDAQDAVLENVARAVIDLSLNDK